MSFSSLAGRLVSLQHRDFRLLWSGQVSSTLAQMMLVIALNWNIYELLRDSSTTIMLFGHSFDLSASALGLSGLSLARVLPVFLFAVPGGLLADMVNRRKLMFVTQGATMLIAAVLTVIALRGNTGAKELYLIAAGMGAASALETPARESLTPNLVPRAHLLNAMSLFTMRNTIGTILGPLLAGFLVDAAGLSVVYALGSLLYVPALITLLLMHDVEQDRKPMALLGWKHVAEGFRFTYRTKVIWSTMTIDFMATVLGSARTMLPILAGDILGMGATGYGVLATAQPVGNLVANIIVSFRKNIYRQGMVFLICVAVYGAATALFGMSTLFVLSYLLWSFTGAADTVSSIIRGTIRQTVTPDELRGRMVGVNMIFFTGGPELGEVRAGLMASVIGAPLTIITGGVMVVGMVAIAAWRNPKLRSYTSATYREQVT